MLLVLSTKTLFTTGNKHVRRTKHRTMVTMTAKPTAHATVSNVFNKGKKYTNIKEAAAMGLVGACAPFPNGFDVLGFCNGVDGSTLQRYREAELMHGRVSMLATVGFLVGEQVQGTSPLFYAQVSGPAVNHFQQVPTLFWLPIGMTIAIAESVRLQKGWQDPGLPTANPDSLFLLKDGYAPGDLNFDPLGLGNGKSLTPRIFQTNGERELNALRLKELNNGRLAMIAISGMVAQELVDGSNLILFDNVLVARGNGELQAMKEMCARKPDDAVCVKAFEATLEATSPSMFPVMLESATGSLDFDPFTPLVA